ncbi:hypothetical protein JDV02_000967 [Purpureocillium takamizusanense]|uniref:Uncharacterized protein n=1 Tax=Purpureocillium takamizusanense TaxID=2060973 RepID=A0A9Q8V6Y8_9HYPO|nr:uncharacterized protein JDV02_000967 [Purpureocillium takamizusanense]UNI14329.1 hypothetical protein JDV02_000967 [Purpureocillium takamizusanense]
MSALQRARSLRRPPPPSLNNTAPSSSSSDKPTAAGERPRRPRTASPSRLPIKPPTTTSTSTSTSTSTTATTSATRTATAGTRAARPASMHLARPTAMTTTTTASASRPQEGPAPRRDASSRYPPLSSSNRPAPTSTQTRRPTSADSADSAAAAATTTAPRRAATHQRAKSNVTKLNSATTLRPPSRDAHAPVTRTARSSSIANPSPSTPPAAAPSKQPLAAAAPQAQVAPPPQQQRRLRPAFSTLQQHYSPAKKLAPKPLTSTYLAPPSPSKLPANVAASAETSKLQAELLQLHLLHRDAAEVDSRWRASAREKLGRRFARLSEACAQQADRQRAAAERENALALRRWGSAGGMGLDDRVQVLDEVLSGLWALGDAGGRYSRAVRRFERWIERARQIEAARGTTTTAAATLLPRESQQQDDSLFIGELDDAWRDECAGMFRRLEAWRAQLDEVDELPDEDEGVGVGHVLRDQSGNSRCRRRLDTAATTTTTATSLERMLRGARHLLDGMLDELRVMEELEREALAREDEWIEAVNKEGDEESDDDDDGDDDDGDDGDNTPRAGAVWRVI